MKTISKLFCAVFFFVGLFSVTACEDEYYNTYWSDNGYYCKNEKENKISIGNISFVPEKGALFVPKEIDGRVVSRLGFKLFDDDGFFVNTTKEGTLVNRYYAPSTIEYINSRYMQYCVNLKFFYCGNSDIDLSFLCLGYENEIYVPFDSFDKLLNNSPDCVANIKKANVCYMFDEDTYYYVDYYETGSKIIYFPPQPEKKGFSFIGWYREDSLQNEWNFSTDTIDNCETEIKLYPKWAKQ